MSSHFRKFSLAAVALTAMGYLVGCGTSGNNTGFQPPPDTGSGVVTTGTGTGSSTTTTTTTTGTTGGLTGGATGTAVVNPALTATAATGLTTSNMLPTAGGGGGATNACTRLGIANFGATLGTRVVVVQGNGNGVGQGKVTLLPRNPDVVPGTSNISLSRVNGTAVAPQFSATDPFGLLVEANTIYVTNNFRAALQGSLIRFTNIQANGGSTVDVIGTVGGNPLSNLANPIDVIRDGNFLYVAEYQARGAGGQIRRINETTGAVDVLVTNTNFCSSMVLDTSNGRKFLYIAENGNTSGSGAQGGIARIDLSPTSAFVAGSPLTTGGTGTTSSPGVTFIQPQTGDAAYANPFDLAIDDTGNVVISEGITYFDPTTFIAQINQGRIRVIKGTVTGGAPSPTSRTILTGLTGSRGVSIVREDTAGDSNTVFFIDGPVGVNSNARQVTFRNTDGGIFRYLLLDQGKLNALDTLFDTGSTANPVVPANMKYTVSFTGGTNGQVIDIR